MRIGHLVPAALLVTALLARAPLGSVAQAADLPEPLPGTAAAGEPCGSETQLEALLARDPAMAARRSILEALVSEAQRVGLAPKAGERSNGTQAAPIYTIPVVVHIDMETSAGLLYSERTVPVLAVPRTPPSGQIERVGATPNPFRHELTVEFELSHRSELTLALFDVSGRRVRMVAQGSAEAGRTVRTMNAAGLASGVYFLRLEAEGRVRTRRVVLLRE